MKTFSLSLIVFLSIQLNLFSQDYWEEIETPNGISIYEVCGVTDDHILIGGSEGLYTTFDGGNTWEHSIPSANGCFHINANNNAFYANVNNKLYYKTGINGDWTLISGSKGTQSGDFYFINDTTILWAIGNDILRTNDGGYNWAAVHEGAYYEIFHSISKHPSGDFFAGSSSWDAESICGIYKGSNNLEDWERIAFDSFDVNYVRINSRGSIYLGISQGPFETPGGICRSNDLGLTWDTLKQNLFVTGLIINQGDSIYVSSRYGINAGVHFSPDNGQTWHEITDNIAYDAIYNMKLGQNGYLYAISDATEDKLYRSKNPVTVGINDCPFSSNRVVSIYPNPAKNHLNVVFENNHNRKHIFIYSMNGLLINSTVVASKQTSIDVSNLPKGCYILQSYFNKHFENQIFIKN